MRNIGDPPPRKTCAEMLTGSSEWTETLHASPRIHPTALACGVYLLAKLQMRPSCLVTTLRGQPGVFDVTPLPRILL